jgi:hypothetical protein
MSSCYTPELSSYKTAQVINFDGVNVTVKLDQNSRKVVKSEPTDSWIKLKKTELEYYEDEDEVEVDDDEIQTYVFENLSNVRIRL